ncbi:glutamate 5-kinase [Methylophilaceae bacterium]|jgi:glutamate 5-kinase|nr:glutamate 5-kinase [Methylophilaceae bacterium]
MKKFNFSEAEKIVIKLGSSIVTDAGNGLDERCLSSLIKQISILSSQDKKVILVSSGAIVAGLKKLGIKKKPKILSELQSAAAVGQMDLVRMYEKLFSDNDLISAQVLLTHNDLSDRKRYLNARSTIFNLIKNNVIPVINENDTVASEEIRFGDNDTLAAMVANLIEADILVLLTDQDGLFSSDPSQDNNARLIRHGYVDDKSLDNSATGTNSEIGTGGMTTKILAARRAALSGTHTIIASGKRNNVLEDLSRDENIGTFLQSREVKLVARKKWLADNLKSNGKIFIDDGAEKALIQKGKSLLVAGVTKVTGTFDRGEVIQCVNESGEEILKGIVNYNSKEVKKIIGLSSDKIEAVLGYVNESSLIHRNNMIIIQTARKKND